MARQLGLDRQMIGSLMARITLKTRTARPTRYCIAVWLAAKSRNEAPQRIMPGITLTSRDENNAVIASGTYGNIDAAISDASQPLWIPVPAALLAR